MEYAGDPNLADVDAQWIVEGPNSGGVVLFVLWRGHMFRVEHDFSSGSVGSGIPAADFARMYRSTSNPRYRVIVADLDARGLS